MDKAKARITLAAMTLASQGRSSAISKRPESSL